MAFNTNINFTPQWLHTQGADGITVTGGYKGLGCKQEQIHPRS
jgi:hypothetical protein